MDLANSSSFTCCGAAFGAQQMSMAAALSRIRELPENITVYTISVPVPTLGAPFLR